MLVNWLALRSKTSEERSSLIRTEPLPACTRAYIRQRPTSRFRISYRRHAKTAVHGDLAAESVGTQGNERIQRPTQVLLRSACLRR